MSSREPGRQVAAGTSAARCLAKWQTTVRLGRPLVIAALLWAAPASAKWTLIGWNNLGMHCMDADYSVFSLLPPYNTIQAQLIDQQGLLVVDPTGITVTYEAVADPDGSINQSSIGKTNFWGYVLSLFGVARDPDVGLTGVRMPGANNDAQPMTFDASASWFIAEGIPITPYDDQGKKNPYPLMRLTARSNTGTVLATTDIVLPVSDEMHCTGCHASEASPAAMPFEGWVYDPDPQRDMRLNILRLHDERELGNDTFVQALSDFGYNPDGLFATATVDGKSILCASCHASNALPGTGRDDTEPLTMAVHRRMALTADPVTGVPLEAIENRTACYQCHPGSVTRCLRGAMGRAVSADGALAIQCQSCHGTMLAVAAEGRAGWLDEPACQSCHTGTAVHNNGEIRYLRALEDDGTRRVAVDQTFATNPDTPMPGFSLYRFSSGHGGLKCEACHGSTHAEYPSLHQNDNLQSTKLQGGVGALAECTTCHVVPPPTIDGGPHGLHPLGQQWVSQHSDAVEGRSVAACQACHGTDYRGTVLSRALLDRTVTTENFGTKHFWRGFQIGCYTCHAGPGGGEGGNPNQAPHVVTNSAAMTSVGTSVAIPLSASDADGDPLELRIVSQAAHGTVGLQGTTATYFPDASFAGADSFTFAAWDGSTDSNLGTVMVTVTGDTPTLTPTRNVAVSSTPTPSETPTETPTIEASPTGTSTSTPTATQVPTSTPTPQPALARAIGTEETQIPVTDGDRLPASGTVRIDDELITYTGNAGGMLLGAARGAGDTVRHDHAAGALVTLVGTPGDANCDGRLSAADLVAVVMRIAIGTPGICGADVDGSQAVDETDLRLAIRGLFGAQ